MARLAHCKGENCGKELPLDDRYRYSNKWYCKECYEKIKNKPNPYRDLIAYMCNEFGIEAPTSLMVSQIKNLKNTRNYTYGGMQYTIWYYKYVLNKELDDTYGIGFVKYHYTNAEKYFKEQVEMQKKVEEMKNTNITTKKKVVKYRSNNNTVNNMLLKGYKTVDNNL